jgi:hypothetical protein
MHRLENRMRVLIGLWILAGLVVAGINGTLLLQLLDEPLAGYSTAVRNASRGFAQYRMLLTTEARKITSGMDLLASRYTLTVVKKESTAAPDVSVRPAARKGAPVSVALPTLTGIMTSRSTDGTAKRLAVMDGRICNEGDRLGDFTVKGITRRGVRLAKAGRTWFLKAPEVAHSLTTR